MIVATKIHKIFETSSSFHVKQCTTGKVPFLLFRRLLLVLKKFHLERRTEYQTIILSSFEIFLIIPNFLRCYVLSRSATFEATHTSQFITNNHASFHLWRKDNLLNHQRVSVYYEHACLQILLWVFMSLLTAK